MTVERTMNLQFKRCLDHPNKELKLLLLEFCLYRINRTILRGLSTWKAYIIGGWDTRYPSSSFRIYCRKKGSFAPYDPDTARISSALRNLPRSIISFYNDGYDRRQIIPTI